MPKIVKFSGSLLQDQGELAALYSEFHAYVIIATYRRPYPINTDVIGKFGLS